MSEYNLIMKSGRNPALKRGSKMTSTRKPTFLERLYQEKARHEAALAALPVGRLEGADLASFRLLTQKLANVEAAIDSRS